MTEPQKLSVFLCHSPADKAAIRDLYNRLLKYPWIDPWLDEEKLLPGHDRKGEISKALEKAHVIIIGLSKDSITKEGPAQAEFKYAQEIALEKTEGAIFIIPLNLEDVKDLDIPSKLRDLQSEDYFPNKRRVIAFEKILKSLKVRANKLDIPYEDNSPIVTTLKASKNKYSKENITIERGVVSTAEFPIREIPFRKNLNFTGRKDILDSIHDEFSVAQNRVPIHAIRGMGGIGKTQTAVHYSYEFAQEYDLVYWIRSETDASLTADYEALTQTLQLPVKTKAEQLVYVNIVNSWLENTDKKWLLVFDNVESQEKIEKLLPHKGNGHILITSQSPNWKELGDDSQIRPFTNEEAREFFKKRLGKDELENADKLTELMGGLPLALEQACAYMATHGTPIAIYIKLFEEQQGELWKRETPPKEYKSTIMTTWEMAFKQIQESHPVAKQLLNLFAFFGPDDIPVSIIKIYPDSLTEELGKAVRNPIELEENLSAIYRYSLVERNGDFISFHRLVQDVIRTQLPKETAAKWVNVAVQIIKMAFPYDAYDIETWSKSAQLLPHALAIANYAEKYSTRLEEAAEIYQKVGNYLRGQAEYDRAGKVIEHAIDIWQEISETNNENFANSLACLGEIRWEQANYTEALELNTQALNIFQLGKNLDIHLGARVMNNLGLLFYSLGEFEKSKEYYEKSLALYYLPNKERSPDTAKCFNGLGVLHQSLGNYEKAREHLEESLSIRRALLGEYHPDVAMSLSDLGNLFADQSEFEKAVKYDKEALDVRRKTLGDNHPNTATSLNNLGGALLYLGEPKRAQEYFEQAYSINLAVFGENHPRIATNLNNIGILLARQLRYVEARRYLEQSLSITEKIHGLNHHDLIIPLKSLAKVMFNLRLFPAARQYLDHATKICSESKVKYKECEDIEELQKLIPMIGRTKNRKKKQE